VSAGGGLHLLLAGASHRSAPLGLRECMTPDAARRDRLYDALAGVEGLSGAVILSTCNRVELYAAAAGETPVLEARALFAKVTGLEVAGFDAYGYEKRDAEAARHLMEVCAGLDSQMIGETEILGQAKQAYGLASERGRSCAALHRLFQKSFQAAKWAREHSGIGTGQVSLGAVAVELSRRIHGSPEDSRIMVVGSGQVGADVARAMQLRGAKDIVVSSRTAANAAALAEAIGARSVPFEAWPQQLQDCDIVIFCAAAQGVLLRGEQVHASMSRRHTRPLFLIDLAMPLDVEPSVAEIPDVFLYTFEDLAVMANENMRGRLGQVELCRSDISGRAARLWDDLCQRSSAVDADKVDNEPDQFSRASNPA